MCIFRDAMGVEETVKIETVDTGETAFTTMSMGCYPKSEGSDWLSQAKIDRPEPSPAPKFSIWKRIGIWISVCVFCLATWLLVYNGVKAVIMWWRW